MDNKLLVILDGSELAEVVFTYAKEFAVKLDLGVILLHVYSPALRDFIPMHQAYVREAARTIKYQAQDVQKRLGIESIGKPVKVQGELAMGYPADEILRYSDENTVDYILMASHGHSGIRRWVMGSVADKVLRASKVPVWLIRAGVPNQVPYDQWPTKTIVVPLDGSELDKAVLPYVKALAKQLGTEPLNVSLLRVCDLPVTPSYYSPEISGVPLNYGVYLEQEIARNQQVAKEYLDGIAKQFIDIGISVQSEVLVGKAADEIINYVNRNPFSIITMTTHGRSGLSRLVYGSVTESVLPGVSSPMLLVRTDKTDTKE